MKILRHWKVILALLLVFGAGTVTGSVLTIRHFKRAFEHGLTVEGWTDGAMKAMQRDLSLTPEQQPKIRVLLDELGKQFKGTFGEAVKVSGTNLVTFWHRVDQELTPEQQAVFHRKCQEFRDGLSKALKIDLPPN